MEEISNKINIIDTELSKITQMHHEKMVEKKIIPYDDKFKYYRKRYNSVINPRGTNNFASIYVSTNKKKQQKRKINIINDDNFTENKDSKEDNIKNKNKNKNINIINNDNNLLFLSVFLYLILNYL